MAQVVEILPRVRPAYVIYIVSIMAADDQGPLLLTWFDLNPSMDK